MAYVSSPAPPTRILSWRQMVQEADPNFVRLSLQPWVYEFSNGRLFVDTLPTYPNNPDSGLTNTGGALMWDGANKPWPTSPAGLPPGAVWWSPGGSGIDAIVVVPGGVRQPGAPPMTFGRITSDQLLATGASNLSTTSPPAGSGILWIGFNFQHGAQQVIRVA